MPPELLQSNSTLHVKKPNYGISEIWHTQYQEYVQSPTNEAVFFFFFANLAIILLH